MPTVWGLTLSGGREGRRDRHQSEEKNQKSLHDAVSGYRMTPQRCSRFYFTPLMVCQIDIYESQEIL